MADDARRFQRNLISRRSQVSQQRKLLQALVSAWRLRFKEHLLVVPAKSCLRHFGG
jgi:hypothetical protein